MQLTDPSLLSSELIKPDLVQLPASNALKTGAEISQEAAPISDNHAVAWIDSTSFQSLSAPAGPQLNSTQPVIDNLVSNAKNTTDKPTIDTLTSDAAKNALGTKFTEDFMQTLKSSVDVPGVGGEKAPSTQKEIDNTSLLQNTQANTPLNQPTHATGQTKSLEIPVNINNPGWGDKFAEQISWLGHQEIKSAVIKIHPEELGPLEISVKVDKDSASVNIISHSSHVRDIVDQAIPRLRDMMAEQGLNLSDVHVNSDRNSGQFSQQNNNDQQGSSSNSADEEVQLVTNIKKRPQGLIDYFA